MKQWNQLFVYGLALSIAMVAGSDAFAQRGRRPDPAAARKAREQREERRSEVRQERRTYDVQYTSVHHMAGCGLGSLMFKEEDKWTQVGASILNGTGMQSFAISFGTSNCTYDGIMDARRESEAFIEANYADLSRDIAVGEGEYVAALATLYGCGENEKAAFVGGLRSKSTQILEGGIQPAKVMSAADDVIRDDARLVKGCAKGT